MTQTALTYEQACEVDHSGHLMVVRLGKAALLASCEVGAALRQRRDHLGDEFGDWVDQELGLSRDEANGYIRFYEKLDVSPSQLSPAVHLELPRIIDGLGLLVGAFSRTAKSRGGSSDAVPAGELTSPEPTNTPRRPLRKAEASDPSGENGEPRLTDEQRRFLLDRSPRLYAEVRKGELSPEEAVRAAQDLPIRKSLQQTLPQERCRQAHTATNHFSKP